MKKYDRLIVNSLLDSYENSAVFRGKNETNQRIYFRITKRAFPEYFDVTSAAYDMVHQAVSLLEYEGIANVYWKDNKAGHILEKVSLNLENLDSAYRFVSRVPLSSKIKAYVKFMEVCPYEDETIRELLLWILERLEQGQPVKKYLDLNNLDEFEQVLKGAHAVLNNEKECFVRELSMILYGDSKKLEALRGKIESIIVNFSSANDFYDNAEIKADWSYANAEDVFQEFNVLKNPTMVVLKGAGVINTRAGRIDVGEFCQGLGLCSEDLEGLIFQPSDQVKRIVTIENLTAFHRFREADTLVIYLGGFHNRARRQLICNAHKAYPSAELLHWGDIDAGGFRIYFDLCNKTRLPFKTINMGVTTLEKYKEYAKTITDNDIKAIENLEVYLANNKEWIFCKADGELDNEIFEVLRWMLDNKLKLEQEIVAYKDNVG